MARVLVVYYSRSGNTRRVAEAVAATTGWELEELVDRRPRAGLRGWLRAGYEALRGRTTTIAPPRRDPRDFALIVVGTPVWAQSPSCAVRTWLELQRGMLPDVAFFVTQGRSGARRVLRRMAALAGKKPVAELALMERDLGPGNLEPAVARFVATLERRRPELGEIPPPRRRARPFTVERPAPSPVR